MRKRVFFALPVTKGLYPKIYRLEKELSKKLKINWIPVENLHLTILFLGYLKEEDLFILDKTIDFLKNNYPECFKKISLKIKKIDYGPPYKKRMVWLYIEKNEKLEKIRNIIIRKISEYGINFKMENRDFLPHINLARLKFRKDNHFPIIEQRLNWSVIFNKIVLYESHLKKPFAQYEVLKMIDLD